MLPASRTAARLQVVQVAKPAAPRTERNPKCTREPVHASPARTCRPRSSLRSPAEWSSFGRRPEPTASRRVRIHYLRRFRPSVLDITLVRIRTLWEEMPAHMSFQFSYHPRAVHSDRPLASEC